MISAEEELIKAFSSIESIEIQEEYRIYYAVEDNKVMYVLANQFPANNNNWLPITKEQYVTLNCQWLWIEDGKIVERKPTYKHYFSLTKNIKDYKIVKDHAGIILEEGEEYSNIGYYGKRNS